METKFLCFKLKPHSFFLLTNFFAAMILSGVIQSIGLELYYNYSFSSFLKLFLGILLIWGSISIIMNGIAFFVYIFKDSFNNKFQKLNIQIQNNFLLVTTIIALLLSCKYLFEKDQEVGLVYYLHRWFLSIILMQCQYSLNNRMLKIIQDSLTPNAGDQEREPVLR